MSSRAISLPPASVCRVPICLLYDGGRRVHFSACFQWRDSMCDVFLILRAMLRFIMTRRSDIQAASEIVLDGRTAIHSEKSRRLVLLSSFAEGLSSPPPPLPPIPALIRPRGHHTLWSIFTRCATYINLLRSDLWRVGLYVV